MNPYEFRKSESAETPPAGGRWSRRLGLLGVVTGIAVPLARAAWVINQARANPSNCGMSILGAIILVLFGCPFLGIVLGGTFAMLGTTVDSMTQPRR